MKKTLGLFLAFLSLAACSKPTPIYYDGWIVDFKDDVSVEKIAEIEKELDISLQPNSKIFNQNKITITKKSLTDSQIEDLRDTGLVQNVERNQIISIFPNEHIGVSNEKVATHTPIHTNLPNDPLYLDGKQWNFDMVGMPDVWGRPEVALGTGVVVAVLDTGVSNGSHTAARVPDMNQTCILEGFNFVDNSTDAYDAVGHGTHVSGTIAQSTNNGIGVAGLAPGVCILPVKVLSDEGIGTIADIVDGLYFAVASGATVVNLSLGSSAPSASLKDAIEKVAQHGVFLACAAGNDGEAHLNYPAGFEGCHAVSALDHTRQLAWYSSFGDSVFGQKVFLSAPGGDTRESLDYGIWQDTVVDGDLTRHGYFPFQGTSMATPHVAAAAALVLSNLKPEDRSLENVEVILAKSAVDLGDEVRFGYGALDINKALLFTTEKANKSSWWGSLVVGLLSVPVIFWIVKKK